MAHVKLKNIVQTAVISAFTIATALIWRDVIIEAIQTFFPPGEQLRYKLITAVAATIALFLMIFIILKAEEEVEVVFRRIKKKRK